MADTKIEYSEKVLDVSGGCTKCAPGCRGCWAIKEVWRMAHNPKLGDKWQGLVEKKNGELNWTGKIKCFDHALVIPLLRRKPTTYFVDSKADLFHPKVRFKFITRLHDRIDVCQQHTFLIFTKRIERAKEYYLDYLGRRIPENIHLGVSISNQSEADEKIPILLQIPAAVRFLSIEPMLEEINLCVRGEPDGNGKGWQGKEGGYPYIDCLTGWEHSVMVGRETNYKIGWVVVGGESGPGARPMKPDWVRSIRDQCVAAGVKFYFKQWGKYIPYEHNAQPPFLSSQHGDFIDGHILPDFESDSPKGQWIRDEYNQVYRRVGKKKAGSMLDDWDWKQLPERR